jgi:hypothetical protein
MNGAPVFRKVFVGQLRAIFEKRILFCGEPGGHVWVQGVVVQLKNDHFVIDDATGTVAVGFFRHMREPVVLGRYVSVIGMIKLTKGGRVAVKPLCLYTDVGDDPNAETCWALDVACIQRDIATISAPRAGVALT